VVRGGLPPHRRSLLVQSGSRHERRLLIGRDNLSELIKSHCRKNTASDTAPRAFSFSVILVRSSRGLYARGDGSGNVRLGWIAANIARFPEQLLLQRHKV
jgi:hypothetical protein